MSKPTYFCNKLIKRGKSWENMAIGYELRVASGRNLYKNAIHSSQNHPSFDSLPAWREEKNICTELWLEMQPWDFHSTVK